jgi:nucleoside-diphosphate-sugar epimerase
MNVLITGGYGFLGSWIIRHLAAEGCSVWVYDLKEDASKLVGVLREEHRSQVRYHQGDVTDLEGLRHALAAHRITHVCHLAGLQVPVCRDNPILGGQVNVLGTLAVFEASRMASPRVERVVYASSAAVFGPQGDYGSPGPLADDVKLTPATHYGWFKVCNEGNARVYGQDHGLQTVGLRPWTVYGPGRDFGMTSEPTRAIKCLALGRPYHISYGGWQDMQYVEDVAAAFVRCLAGRYAGPRAYNLRGDVVDLPTLHQALCQVDPRARHLITHGERQIGIAYDLSDDALQRDYGPLPKTPLVEGARRTYEHFQRLHAVGALDLRDIEARA